MKKSAEMIMICFFLIMIFSMSILTIISSKENYSVFENRALATRPTINKNDLLSGKYFKNWDTYISDHIYLRDEMFSTYVNFQMNVLKKPVVNNTVICGDTLLPFMGYPTLDLATLQVQINHMANELGALHELISSYGGKFLYVGIPEQHSILRDAYPWYMNNDDKRLSATETMFFSSLHEKSIPYINMYPLFKNGANDYYSKIDHHFTYQGAYYTYQNIMKALKIVPQEFDIHTIPNPYYGSRNRKLYNQFKTTEYLQIGYPKGPVPFTREDNDKLVSNILFTIPKSENTPVTYTAYMGGDVAETIIRTNRTEFPNILIFGDSFTNPLESMIYIHGNETRSLDLRHYKKKSLFSYVKEYKPDIVLCIRDDTMYWNADGNGKLR